MAAFVSTTPAGTSIETWKAWLLSRVLTAAAPYLSGLAIAWRAYTMSRGGKPAPIFDGFTGEQRSFLSSAQAWKGRVRDEYLRRTFLSTPHAPPEFRANGPASNMPAFHEAFGTKPRDGMYREPGSRITIW